MKTIKCRHCDSEVEVGARKCGGCDARVIYGSTNSEVGVLGFALAIGIIVALEALGYTLGLWGWLAVTIACLATIGPVADRILGRSPRFILRSRDTDT